MIARTPLPDRHPSPDQSLHPSRSGNSSRSRLLAHSSSTWVRASIALVVAARQAVVAMPPGWSEATPVPHPSHKAELKATVRRQSKLGWWTSRRGLMAVKGPAKRLRRRLSSRNSLPHHSALEREIEFSVSLRPESPTLLLRCGTHRRASLSSVIPLLLRLHSFRPIVLLRLFSRWSHLCPPFLPADLPRMLPSSPLSFHSNFVFRVFESSPRGSTV
jgi:hypothetical protein